MYHVIFIDDENLIREFFQEMFNFSNLGFQLDATFEGAEAALDYLENHSVDVVITDIRMGEMSGIEFCEIVRKKDPDLVLVLLTGYREFEYAQRAIHQNVFDYLVKPTSYSDIENLFQRLQEFLNNKKKVDKQTVEEPKYQDLVEKMRQLARDHIEESFSLEKAAQILSMNPAYLSRLFKQQCSQNYTDYLTQLRICHAKELLANPTVKVYEIGFRVGYKNTQHFYKIFKQITGMTPSEYRRSHLKDE